MIDRRFRLVFLLFTCTLLACSSETSAPRGSIGPESLTVAFQAFPDTVPATGSLIVGAIAINATSRMVFGRWETGRCGLTVRVFQPSGGAYATVPPVCRGSGTWTMASGESTSTGLAIGGSGWPRGTYRIRAQVEAVNSQSPAIERTVVLP